MLVGLLQRHVCRRVGVGQGLEVWYALVEGIMGRADMSGHLHVCRSGTPDIPMYAGWSGGVGR